MVALLGLAVWASGVAPTLLPRSDRIRGSGYGIPPADTGNRVLDWINGILMVAVHLERRVDVFFRPAFDRWHPQGW